jgi:hypothetical protein
MKLALLPPREEILYSPGTKSKYELQGSPLYELSMSHNGEFSLITALWASESL